MLRRLTRWLACMNLCVLATLSAAGQITNQVQRFTFAGLRAPGTNAQFLGIQSEASGTLLVLDDEGDGIRLLRVGATNHELVSQALLGAAGDHGTQLALGPAGEIYVAGTASSGLLGASPGAAIGQPSAGLPSTFVARLDPTLNLQWLSFTGASRSTVTAIAANASGVFVAGFLYGAGVPVTPNAFAPSPAFGSFQNGFLESFSPDGSNLVYATYLTGAGGDTTPTGITVDSGSNAWVVGSTTASGFPTISAIVPEIQSSSSGFVVQVTPAGDGLVWSTFVPGTGLSAIALDATGHTLLITGVVSLGQFPVDTVEFPIVPLPYQVLLRMSLDGTTVLSGTVVAPGVQSSVTATGDGGAWVSGVLPPGSVPTNSIRTLATTGSGFSVHITSAGKTDQAVRLGGLPTSNLTFASLPVQINATIMSAQGRLMVAGSMQPTASSSLLGSETYDVPLNASTASAFPSPVRDAEASPASCSGSLCAGTAGYLAEIDTGNAGPSLLLASDNAPLLKLSNLGSSPASGVTIAGSASPANTSCGVSLAPGSECAILVSGTGSGTLSVSADGIGVTTFSYPAPRSSEPDASIFFSPREIDFGIQNDPSGNSPRVLTLENLGSSPVTFSSAPALGPKQVTPFSLSASNCPSATVGMMTLAAGSSCQMSFSFLASSDPSQDGPKTLAWNLGTQQVLLTGYSLSASLTASSEEIDFGTVISGSPPRARYLFLSNQSQSPLHHTPVTLTPTSVFSVTDECPSVIQAGGVCRLSLFYGSPVVPSVDDLSLVVDSLTIEVTGSTVAAAASTGSTVNPNLSVSPMSASFSDPVAVTAVSASTQTIAVSNSGASSIPLAFALTGDFADSSSCLASLDPGSSCAVAITFTPSQPGVRRGLLSISSGPNASPTLVPLSGSSLSILPDDNGLLSLGTSPVGQPAVQFYKVSEPFSSLTVRTSGPYRVALIEDTGAGHGSPPSSIFVTSGTGTCHNCWLALSFQPTAAGVQTGTLTLTSDPRGLPYTVDLSGVGTAVAGLVLTPTFEDFSSIPVNSASGASLFTLTNLGDPAALLTVANPVVIGPFVVTAPPPPSPACGGVLAFGAACAFQVAFAPASVGKTVATLSMTTSAGTVTAQLSGTGTPDSGVGISPEALTFSNGSGIASTQQGIRLTNTSSAPLVVGVPKTDSANFAASTGCGTVPPAGSCSVAITFFPTQALATGTVTIPVTLSGEQQHLYSVALSGAYTIGEVGILVTPALAEFGPDQTGIEGPSRQYGIFNSTSQSLSLTLSVPRQFTLATPPCTVLAAAASCSFIVASIPLTNGDITGTLTVQGAPADGSATISNQAYAESFGIGSGTLSLSGGQLADGSYNFGEVSSGQTSTQTFVVTNASTANEPPITVRRVRSAAPFLSTTTCSSALAPGASCLVAVSYSPINQVMTSTTPTPSTPDAGVLTIESDATTSPDVISLTGLAGPVSVSSPVNNRNLPDYVLSQQSMTFANTTVGDASVSQQTMITNSGNSLIHILSTVVSTDFDLESTCSTLAPGDSCSLSARSKPVTSGSHVGAIEVSTDSTQSLDFISLFSDAGPSALRFSPLSLSFGPVEVGGHSTLPLTLTNAGSLPIVFRAVSSGTDYSSSGTCPPPGQSMAPQSSCVLQVIFAPSAVGMLNSALSFDTSASTFPLLVPLSGTGTILALTATPSTLDFGTIAVGAASARSLTITNTGTATAASLQSMVSGDFQIASPCGQSTLQPGAQCTTTLTFSPKTAGAATGTYSLTNSSSGPPLVVPLTGVGLSTGGFALTVDGGTSSSITIVQGDFASFNLQLEPQGQYTGAVALSCLPPGTALFANCTVTPSVVPLANGAQNSLASINTVTIGYGVSARNSRQTWKSREWSPGFALALLSLCLLPRKAVTRPKLKRRPLLLVFGLLSATLLFSGGCGSGNSLNAHFTPAGTYRFQIVGSTTSGASVTHSVTLNVVVTNRS